MKKLSFMFILLVLSSFCFAGKDKYNIKVRVHGVRDSLCYLGYHYGDKQYIKDTAKADENGNFTFSGKEKPDGGIYLIVLPGKKYFEIIMNESNFSLETDTSNLIENMKVTGSVENKLFFDFMKEIGRIQKDAPILQNDLKLAKDKNDINKVKELQNKLSNLEKQVNDLKQNIINQNPNTLIAKIFKASDEPKIPDFPGKSKKETDSLRFEYYKTHFWDNIDFSDDRILRTPIFHSKLKQYIDNLTYQIPDSISNACDFIAEKARANKEVFKYCIYYMTNTYETSSIVGFDAVFVHMVEKYYMTNQAFWVDSVTLYKITDRAMTLKPLLVGKQSMDLILMDTVAVVDIDKKLLTKSGNQFQLYDNKSKYTVLVFWDPDCGHCKTAIPKLRGEYDKIKSHGGEVVAVCVESDTQKWKKFIRDNKLNWINGIDPLNTNKIHKNFDINSTPQIYLLDKDKRILAKKLGVDQVVEVMDKIDKGELRF